MPIEFRRTIELIGGATITGVPTPVNPSDIVNLAYFNAGIEGSAWKDNARVATQSNINLSSPGTTIDSISMASGNRVVVLAQTNQSQNGIYIWNGSSTPMTRALDASTFTELKNAVISVDEGTSAGATFRQTQIAGTIDSDPIVFTPFNTGAAPASESIAGIIEIATQAEVNTGTANNLAVTPQTLANYSGRLKKVSQNIGDGSATLYTVTHNLNTRDVTVQVYANSGNFDDVFVEIRRPTVDTVSIVFESAPASNAFRVVIIG